MDRKTDSSSGEPPLASRPVSLPPSPSPLSASDRQRAGKTTIPAVMLSNADGRFILDALDYLENFQLTPQLVIDLQAFPAIFDTDAMGYGQGHPSIRVSENVVHVLGQGLWSVVLTKTESGEWQLFIVQTRELRTLVPWTILSSGRQGDLPLSTNPSFLASPEPVALYRQLISEQCPVDIEWDQTRDVIYRSD
jgi:hypothetical protein